jgi:hypothetical protein
MEGMRRRGDFGMRAKKLAINILVLICIVLAAGLVAGFCLILYEASIDNYFTNDDFSVENFKQIKAGMTCQEVRNLIGIPLNRWRGSRWWIWKYSMPLVPEKRYREYEVVFDNTTNKVIWIAKPLARVSWVPRANQWAGLRPKPASAWQITDFNYPMIQGQLPEMREMATRTYIIQVMATWCKPCARDRARIKELLKKDLSDVSVELLLVSVDESEQALRKYLDENRITVPVAWDPKKLLSKPMNQSLIPRHLLLRGGTLYPFDFPHFSGESEDFYDDLKWFIRRITTAP